MTESPEPYHAASLAFPDTRVTSERLWVSSALSVLRARQQGYAVTDPLSCAYTLATEALTHVEYLLRAEEEIHALLE